MRAATTSLALLLFACADAEPEARHTHGDAVLGGEVVSVVDGDPIRAADVARVVRTDGVSPREALDRLQTELLLAHEAERLGYEVDRDVPRKAAVQALLAQVEEEIPPSSITDAATREVFEERAESLGRPERRVASHVLVHVPEGAPESRHAEARTHAERILAELRAAPEETLERYRALAESDAPRIGGFEVVFEDLPALGTADLEAGFADVLFAIGGEEGAAPVAAQTSYGWHAIWLREVEPGVTPSYDALKEELAADVLTQRRFARLRELLAQIESRFGVDRDERRIAQTMHLALEAP